MALLKICSDSKEMVKCTICMKNVGNIGKNMVITACGHIFHTSCLITNVILIGLECPACNVLMLNDDNSSVSDDDKVSSSMPMLASVSSFDDKCSECSEEGQYVSPLDTSSYCPSPKEPKYNKNLCAICHIDMGDHNPRQFCGKIRCDNIQF